MPLLLLFGISMPLSRNRNSVSVCQNAWWLEMKVRDTEGLSLRLSQVKIHASSPTVLQDWCALPLFFLEIVHIDFRLFFFKQEWPCLLPKGVNQTYFMCLGWVGVRFSFSFFFSVWDFAAGCSPTSSSQHVTSPGGTVKLAPSKRS